MSLTAYVLITSLLALMAAVLVLGVLVWLSRLSQRAVPRSERDQTGPPKEPAVAWLNSPGSPGNGGGGRHGPACAVGVPARPRPPQPSLFAGNAREFEEEDREMSVRCGQQASAGVM